jgi:thiamine biosynthesis lipoprotein
MGQFKKLVPMIFIDLRQAKQHLGKVPLAGTFLMLLLLILGGCNQEKEECQFSFETMGTVAALRLMLPAELPADEAIGIVQDSFAEVNTALSTWSPNSELSRLSRAAADSAVNVSPLLRTCLARALLLSEQSGGAFDPTAESLMRLWGFYRRKGVLPGATSLDSALADLGKWRLEGNPACVVKDKPGTHFDLGGIAKGLAVDLAVARLRKAGLDDGLLDLGGNLYCMGGAPGRENWRVGIRNPHNRDELFATVTISQASVATSGSYERFVTIDGRRYGHIMNPATGRPAEGLLSASVIAEEGILADGLSTTLFVLGPDAAWKFLAKYYPEVEAILVVPAAGEEMDTVMATRGLRDRLALLPGFEKQYRIIFAD